jgi:hypothetical protein
MTVAYLAAAPPRKRAVVRAVITWPDPATGGPRTIAVTAAPAVVAMALATAGPDGVTAVPGIARVSDAVWALRARGVPVARRLVAVPGCRGLRAAYSLPRGFRVTTGGGDV